MVELSAQVETGHAGEAEAGHHDPTLAHHFDSQEQQYASGKLGIWLFLTTEILFFSGLFCAYAVYRSMHPEIFEYAHYYLDTTLGFINTCVLLVSSLTAAWAVRAAQLGQNRRLILCILLTLLGAFGFLGIKYAEYSHKFHTGLLWGERFAPTERVEDLPSYKERWKKELALDPTGETTIDSVLFEKGGFPAPGKGAVEDRLRPKNAHLFFSIYFGMTALHGVHVLAGIAVWLVILIRAMRKRFTQQYFGPVDFAALYWHLVDLVWIYLFPLLYLID